MIQIRLFFSFANWTSMCVRNGKYLSHCRRFIQYLHIVNKTAAKLLIFTLCLQTPSISYLLVHAMIISPAPPPPKKKTQYRNLYLHTVVNGLIFTTVRKFASHILYTSPGPTHHTFFSTTPLQENPMIFSSSGHS